MPYDQPIASVGARLTAAAIDVAVFIGAFFVTGIIAVFVAAAVNDNFVWVWPVQVVILLFGMIANLAVIQGNRGTSIGKSVAGIAVVDDNAGHPIGAARGLARLVLHVLVDPIALVGPLLMVTDTVERRTIADRVCRSVVVSTADGPSK